MPRLSYPGGRTAAARTEQELKTSSVRKTDVVGDTESPSLGEGDQGQQPEHVVQDDASVAFQKQIDALKESERIQKDRADRATQEREDAIRRANEREAEVVSLKKTTSETQADYLGASLAAATAEAEGAQRDIEKALELGDFKGQADAYRRLSKAETAIARLEDGKAALESQTKAAAEEKPAPPKATTNALPPSIQAWLGVHPDYANDPKKNAKINYLHHEVIDEGHAFGSTGYIESMETKLGMRTKPEQNENDDDYEEPQARRPSMVSAPVSRSDPPSASGDKPGTIRLTPAMKEAAKLSGIDEKTYAENLLKLRAHKSNGMYGGDP